MKSDTITSIDEKVKEINNHPEYSNSLRSQEYNLILCEAARHSNSIELVAEKLKGKKLRDKEKISLLRIKEVWDHLNKYDLNLSTLASLGNILEPDVNKVRNFRSSIVQFGPFVPPVDYTQIAQGVKNLLDDLGSKDLHSVTRAIESHIELVRIHPFLDGNGRIARLVQNYCLKEKNYPAAIILPEEREFYIKLLEGTLKDRYDHKSYLYEQSSNEQLFHSFIESKILNSATRLNNHLLNHRRYSVKLLNVRGKPAVAHTLAERFRSHGRRNQGHGGIKVEVCNGDRRPDPILLLEGNINYNAVDSLLRQAKPRYNFNYTLDINKN